MLLELKYYLPFSCVGLAYLDERVFGKICAYVAELLKPDMCVRENTMIIYK